ncbi:putative binding protein component of ABC iron transporter precursor [Pirellulimonas nuda]|uniref:Putative binding protein component of ABC iron transporter n=1 Tax=Pirellulimonas nuda TaxID=2528009 RepID=A0A518D638_9BACT|nr:extracellular solute-binding protein [Pirellulimonas nuda]QDU86936.1 putative binding protein component of ABC iron transporter precursor [Pirellulimonas nuda]
MFRWIPLIALLPLVGCETPPTQPQKVVVYAALDQEFSEPIFAAFTRQTGIEVDARFDTESTKTTGLVQAIIAERDRPRCDLFWNNEALHTLRLEKLGMLRPYAPAHGADFPAQYRAADGAWHGLAARARVLLVNTNIVPEARRPTSVNDLIDPQWYDKAGVAKPLFGTTATHAAVLWDKLGEERAKEFFDRVQQNCRVMAGNKQVAQAVASGALAFGLTDTDDAIIEVEAGAPVAIVYPDQADDELGTLFIPNTLALIKDSEHPREAEALVDFLLSPEVEDRLAMGRGAQIPLNKNSKEKPRVKTPADVKAMEVDFTQAAKSWDAAAAYLAVTFAGKK